MARPRVFVSSTYYDLKHIRSSLDQFIESLGYDPILSEKGDIAYTHDRALDQSCYREAENADIFVLIVGGRYGTGASSEIRKPAKTFSDRYESITKKEYESAAKKNIPIYIFIEAGVYSEYQTYLRNKNNTEIRYAHVDSVNIFVLIEEILARPRNNPVHAFEKYSEVESWLREQWAGLFRELLTKQTQQQQLVALTTEVGHLRELNETLKKYLEAVMTGATSEISTKLIQSEEKRLEELRKLESLRANPWVDFVLSQSEVSLEQVTKALKKATSFDEFSSIIKNENPKSDNAYILDVLNGNENARRDFSAARKILGLASIRKRANRVLNAKPKAKLP